jgi:hypothetical protein
MYLISDGDEYWGTWLFGTFSGVGCITFGNGKRQFRGQFKVHQKCGMGMQDLEEGGYYIGEFDNDQQHGKGLFTLSDGIRVVQEPNSDGTKTNSIGMFSKTFTNLASFFSDAKTIRELDVLYTGKRMYTFCWRAI